MAVITRLNRLLCWLDGGHEPLEQHIDGVKRLSCACGYQTQGWDCTPTLALPPITVSKAKPVRQAGRWRGSRKVA